MKSLLNYPMMIYACSTIAGLCIMVVIDYILGAEAEHLNAWVIINRLFGLETGISDSLAIQHLGLFGATALMFGINALFGAGLVQIIRLVIQFIHS